MRTRLRSIRLKLAYVTYVTYATYASVLILAFLGLDAPPSSMSYLLSKWVLITLLTPLLILLVVRFCIGAYKALPLASKVYRNHPQWRRGRNRRY